MRLFFALTFLAAAALGADTRISDLPEVTSPGSTDVLPIVHAGATGRVQVGNLTFTKAQVGLGSVLNVAQEPALGNPGVSGYVLSSTTSGARSWVALPSGGTGGSGTVTSVAFTAPGIFAASGSPITTSGTIGLTLAVQSAGRVWAGPTTGVAAAPTFRQLVDADLAATTALLAAGDGSQLTGISKAQVGLGNVLNTAQEPALGNPGVSGYVLSSTTGGTRSWVALPSGNGSGTVTSVGITAPGILTVSGSPVTTSGTIGLTLATQAAGRVWAGPTTGSAAPTFRQLVDGDLAATTALLATGDGSQLTGITYAQVGAAAASHTHSFSSLTGKPTSVAASGILDALATGDIGATVQGYSASTTLLGNTTTGTGALVRAAGATLTTAVVNGVTLSGSGTLSTTGGTLGTAAFTPTTDYATAAHTHTFASLTSKPSSLAGYGITDTLLLPANNLSDVASVSTARTNLGLGSIATLTTAALAPSFATLTDGATITLTCDSTKSAQNATVTLGGNRTLAISGATSGMTGVLIVKQDATGSRTLTLPSGSKVIGGGSGAVTLTTTASAIDALS